MTIWDALGFVAAEFMQERRAMACWLTPSSSLYWHFAVRFSQLSCVASLPQRGAA